MSKVYVVKVPNENKMIAIRGFKKALTLANGNNDLLLDPPRFSTIGEAIDWAHNLYPEWKISNIKETIVKNPKAEKIIKTPENNYAAFSSEQLKIIFNDDTGIAFTDGSFKNNTMGCGVVLFAKGERYAESIKYMNEENNCNSLMAEIEAAKLAIVKALSLGNKRLIICYDCEAVKQAAETSGVAQSMKEFHTFYSSIKSIINIVFMKVKGHADVAMNIYADQLARAATKE